jgi:hypothetical protein
VRAHPLAVWPGQWAICRLSADSDVPSWALATGRLVSVTRTATELSIVAPEACVPAAVLAERDFRVIEVVGPVPFSVVGLIAAITRPLAEAGVSVLTLATYDTDYVLVREASLEVAVRVLSEAGFLITA